MVSGHLKTPTLSAPVRVLRDRWGIAHIYAQNQHDLFFTQGYVAAQDRLFQMEVWKRAGQGRLSEILGPSAFARDVAARELRYRGDMAAEYASYGPQTQEILEAFTQGINFYIQTGSADGGKLPAEFGIAGFKPEPWLPEDCLNRMAAFSMTGNAASELEYARTLAELGAKKSAEILDFDPKVALDPDAHLSLEALTPELLENFIGSDQRVIFPKGAHKEGSNNWTISGKLTKTGKPLLANDPHRVMGLPSLRYMVHLVAPGWNVIGASEPGLPGVALGHNEDIAWGFTIFGLDQQDLYVEEINPANPLEYKTADGWATMTVRQETVKIAGAAPRDADLEFTRHGPIIWQQGSRALVLRWVGSEPGTTGYLASLSVDRARNWNEFEEAVGRWKVPSENIVYADRSGNIGEHSVGLAPLRRWSGLLPVPGDGRYEWSGFVPFAELPHVFNPASGFVATANQKMISDNYPYRVGFEWAADYRFKRISAFIRAAGEEHRKLSLADMEALQSDVTSLPAQDFQRLLRSTSLSQEPSLRTLLRWDARLTRDSAEAALYEVWFREITRALGALVSSTHPEHYDDLPPDTVLRLVTNLDPETFGPDPARRRDGLLHETLDAARRALEKQLGTDPHKWQWGRLHLMYFRHALDEQSDSAKQMFDLGPLERPGDEFTVNATYPRSDTWEQVAGASYRQIIDLRDWDESVAINVPGQSGEPTSAHYKDLAPLWDAGKYIPLTFSARAVREAMVDELILDPTPNTH